MKKVVLVGALLVSSAVWAKNETTTEVLPAQGSCMVALSDAKVLRFVNVNYIRAVEVSLQSGAREESQPNMLVVRMSSNYAARSSYVIEYASAKAAQEAARALVESINACSRSAAK